MSIVEHSSEAIRVVFITNKMRNITIKYNNRLLNIWNFTNNSIVSGSTASRLGKTSFRFAILFACNFQSVRRPILNLQMVFCGTYWELDNNCAWSTLTVKYVRAKLNNFRWVCALVNHTRRLKHSNDCAHTKFIWAAWVRLRVRQVAWARFWFCRIFAHLFCTEFVFSLPRNFEYLFTTAYRNHGQIRAKCSIFKWIRTFKF